MTVARALEAVLGPDLPIAVRAYDGSRLGRADAPATLLIRSPNVFRRLVAAPGELGLGRAYVSGELDVEGDIYAALATLRERIPDLRSFGARQWADVLRPGSSLARSGLKPSRTGSLRRRRDVRGPHLGPGRLAAHTAFNGRRTGWPHRATVIRVRIPS